MKNTGHPIDSWYTQTADIPAALPALNGDVRTHVCIIGGGYTGLGAAIELRRRGIECVLLEGARIGSGASGRNGGQMHVGQRLDPQHLESLFGADDARAFWDMSQAALASLHGLIAEFSIDCDLKQGLIHAWHRPKFATDDIAYAEFVRTNYGYDKTRILTKSEVATELGTDVYHGGILDMGGGHLHPLKLALGMAEAARSLGAQIYEHSRVTAITPKGEGYEVMTETGRVLCDHVLLCGNGYMHGLSDEADAKVLPINNFILTTEPLTDAAILPNDYAAADSRFVVNYWRKTPDNRLLFGGGENYTPWFPKDIRAFVRKNMLKIYPQLEGVNISHGWGGTLAITLTRAPFVLQLSHNFLCAAGYSGQGVVLAPYFGKLLAHAVSGDGRDIDLLSRLPVPPFPGGRALRTPALIAGLSWYSLMDKL
ncbi:NAD(P)/FAD-dependent oxidoreductase [Asticcacaulis endophyticus]|uniref:Oxidoreductase n=1 Tax=Asticcacaulis endophyticus TaxID=1395890 RepID=A0A918PZ25_9CAUL|nr:FAD-binding oxidoreductase [Asticcacaulis endophyticus]GGZ27978.1 oxidoreductase [Asticcacaulis endophyticus]